MWIYARCAVKSGKEYDEEYADAAEGAFDAALTNVLASAFVHEWPGQEREKQGKACLRAVGELLMVTTERAVRSARVGGTLRPGAQGFARLLHQGRCRTYRVRFMETPGLPHEQWWRRRLTVVGAEHWNGPETLRPFDFMATAPDAVAPAIGAMVTAGAAMPPLTSFVWRSTASRCRAHSCEPVLGQRRSPEAGGPHVNDVHRSLSRAVRCQCSPSASTGWSSAPRREPAGPAALRKLSSGRTHGPTAPLGARVSPW